MEFQLYTIAGAISHHRAHHRFMTDVTARVGFFQMPLGHLGNVVEQPRGLCGAGHDELKGNGKGVGFLRQVRQAAALPLIVDVG